MHKRSRRAAGAQEVHDQVECLRMQEGRRLEIFSGRGCSRQNEDSRTNNRADPERGQRPRSQRFTEPVLWILRVRNQFVDRLATECLPIGSADDIGGWFSG